MEEKNLKLSVVVSPEKSEKSGEKKSFWHINREMLPYKLHFLFFVGGAGAVFPFQTAFGITVLGLTASNIAACYTALQVFVFLLKPGIGYLADYFNRLKAIIMGLAVLQALFCFFMIIIPNTGMPGIDKIHLTDTLQNKTYCQLCFNHEAFKLSAPKRYLNEDILRGVSSCFNNNVIENISINCSAENFNSSIFFNDSFEIKQATCNSLHANSFLLENNTALSDFYTTEDYIDILYIKSFQNFWKPLVCLLPKGRNFYYMNFSSEDLNQYCYAPLDEATLKLQDLFLESAFTILDCKDLHNNTILQPKDEHSLGIENFKTYQFWVFAICLVLSCAFGSSQFTMSDTACYESIQGNDYGEQRVWGAISWGLIAPIAGYLNDYTESFIAAWCVFACFTVLQIWNLSKVNLVKPNFSQNILKDMKTILKSIEFLCFTTGVLLNGVFTGIIWYYLTWFIVSIGGNKLIIGLVHTIQCYFGEVPAMYFSGWLIKKVGHFNLVSLALISHGIRFFIYSYLHNPWLILPVECLHGLTFGSFYAAMTSYGKLNSKPGTEATTQSILCTTYEALGCGIGCLVVGVCLETFGGHTTFYYASFVCVIATVINIVFSFIIRCRRGVHAVTNATASGARY